MVNGGIWQPPTTIRRMVDAETCRLDRPSACGSLTAGGRDADGTPQRTPPPLASPRVPQTHTPPPIPRSSRTVMRSGTGRAAARGQQAGGKTGTTNDGRDLLFIGYEPSRHWVLGIWLGNDDNSPSASSSALAASLWSRIMRAAGQGALVGQ